MRKIVGLGVSLMVVLFAVSCALDSVSVPSEFRGSWFNAASKTTVVVASDTLEMTSTGKSFSGTCSLSVKDADSKKGHVMAAVTASTGDYSTYYPNGTKFYITYVVNGSTATFAENNTAENPNATYPATAGTTTYTKQ